MKKNTSKTHTATKDINGTTYRAQFNGVRECIRAYQSAGGDELKLDEYLLQNVIVEPPGLTLDDFETLDEAHRVIRFAASVMAGRFRGDKENTGTNLENSQRKLEAVAAGTE